MDIFNENHLVNRLGKLLKGTLSPIFYNGRVHAEEEMGFERNLKPNLIKVKK